MDFKNMLDEINVESLQNLLTSLRSDACPLPNTHIPDLDAHLSSARQAYSPLKSSNAGDVLEIQGRPDSGKTQFLYFLLITCIMPSSYSSVRLNGWDKAAILFDTDASFDVHRFKQLLSSRLKQHLVSGENLLTPESLDELVRRSLQNLHLFRPTSSTQLAATILHLPSYHQTHLSGTEIGIVAIDSMSAFYWLDRFTTEQLRLSSKYKKTDAINPLQHVLIALHKLRLTHLPLIILTNWGLTPANTNGPSLTNGMLYRQHLHPYPSPLVAPSGPGEWSSFKVNPLLHHITLSSSSSSQHSADFSFADAQATEHTRPKTGERKIFGHINTVGFLQTGQFAFSIAKDDITFN